MSNYGSMQSWQRRVEAMEKQQGARELVSTFILATNRDDADRQVRQFAAHHPSFGMTLFVMMGSDNKAA